MARCAQTFEQAASTTADPAGLVEHLDASDRFHRDSLVGRILHPGTVSFRERVLENSVHILIVGHRVSAHVDRYAPLTTTRGGAARYSFWRAAAHNAAHLAEDVVRLLAGRRGEHRCLLECQRVEIADEAVADRVAVPASSGCDARVG